MVLKLRCDLSISFDMCTGIDYETKGMIYLAFPYFTVTVMTIFSYLQLIQQSQ